MLLRWYQHHTRLRGVWGWSHAAQQALQALSVQLLLQLLLWRLQTAHPHATSDLAMAHCACIHLQIASAHLVNTDFNFVALHKYATDNNILQFCTVKCLRTLTGLADLTQMIPPAVTTAALTALRGVRHCRGLRGEQKHRWLTMATVPPLIAFTTPTPCAPSVRNTNPEA